MQIIFLTILGYVSGSLASGKVFGYWFKGVDIQRHGSGNIGFANACRVLGWKIGVLVLVCDVAKGFLPVFAAAHLFQASQAALLITGAAAVLGHAYPVWLGFKGGKSIATGFGVLLALTPGVATCALIAYGICMAVTRTPALGSLAGAVCLPFAALVLQPSLTYYCAALALFAVYTHRSNIRRLVTEHAR